MALQQRKEYCRQMLHRELSNDSKWLTLYLHLSPTLGRTSLLRPPKLKDLTFSSGLKVLLNYTEVSSEQLNSKSTLSWILSERSYLHSICTHWGFFVDFFLEASLRCVHSSLSSSFFFSFPFSLVFFKTTATSRVLPGFWLRTNP